MSLLWVNGNELQSTTAAMEFDTLIGSPTISTTTKRTGDAALRCNPSATTAGYRHQFASGAAGVIFYAQVCIYIASAPSSGQTAVFRMMSGSTSIVEIRLNSDRTLELWNAQGISQIGSDSAAINASEWVVLEMKVTVSAGLATTAVEARINGASPFASTSGLNLTAVDTIGVGALTTTTADLYFDDVIVCNDSGSFMNSYPNGIQLWKAVPNGQGANNQLGSAASTNWQQVDETTPDDGTTVIASTSDTVGEIDDYAITDAPAEMASGATIYFVAVGARLARTANNTADSCVLRLRDSGGNVDEGSAIQPNSNTTWRTNANAAPRNYTLVSYDMPGASTTAITKTDLDSMQIGWKKSADSTAGVNMSALWAYVGFKNGTGNNYTKTLTETVSLVENRTHKSTRLMDTHKDNFDFGGIDTGKWSTWGTVTTNATTNLRLEITSKSGGTDYGGVLSLIHYDMTGSYAYCELVDAGSQVSGLEVYPVELSNGNEAVSIMVAGNTVYARKKIAGSYSTVGSTVAYNSTTMKFFRIRESGGTTYWEYAQTLGGSWTEIANAANPITMTNLLAGITLGTWSVVSPVTTAKFDNFNVAASTNIFSWKGYNWHKRIHAGPPANNQAWSESNIAVNGSGYLVLSITNPTGNMPIGSEIFSEQRGFGYGTYIAVIDTRLDNIHASIGFGGLFTFDFTAPPDYKEIDAHETRHYNGNPNKRILHSHVYNNGGSRTFIVDDMDIPSNSLQTHVMKWESGKITFDSYLGEGTGGTNYFHTEHTTNIPTPGLERVHFNLWVDPSISGYATISPFDVIVKDFSYSAGTLYTKNLTETIALAQAYSNRGGKVLSEATTIVDSVTRPKTAVRTYTENIRLFEVGRTIQEAFNSAPIIGDLDGEPPTWDGTNNYLVLNTAINDTYGALVYSIQGFSAEPGISISFDMWAGGGSGADAIYIFAGTHNAPNSEAVGSSGGIILAFSEYHDEIRLFVDGTLLGQDSFANLDNSTWRHVDAAFIRSGGDIAMFYRVDYGFWSFSLIESFNYFGNAWGIGARTGGLNNEHRIRNVTIHTIESLIVANKTFSEAISIAQVYQNQGGKNLAEALTIVDTNTTQKQGTLLTKDLNEAIAIVDAIIKQLSRTATETISVVDVRTNTTGKNLTESVSIVDSILRTPGKVLAEAIAIVDTRTRSISRTLSEAVAIVDSVIKQPGRTLSEALTIVDTLTKNIVFTKTLSEAVSVVDSIIKTPGKVLSDVISIVDTRTRSISRTIAEALTISDTNTKQTGRTLSETVTVVDTATPKITARILTEIVSIAANVSRSSARVFSETVAIVDNITTTAGLNYVFTESIALVDRLTRQTNRTLSEVVTIAETLQKQGSKVLTQTITVVDSILKGLPAKTYSETLTIADTVNRRPGKVLSDTLTTADTIQKQGGKNLTETVTIVDTRTMAAGKLISAVESITLTDIIAKSGGKVLTEAVTIADSVARTVTYTKLFTEILTISANFSKNVALSKILSEIISISASFSYISAITSAITVIYNRSIGYESKYSSQSTSYTSKYSSQSTSYTNKYSSQGSSYTDKYEPQTFD